MGGLEIVERGSSEPQETLPPAEEGAGHVLAVGRVHRSEVVGAKVARLLVAVDLGDHLEASSPVGVTVFNFQN